MDNLKLLQARKQKRWSIEKAAEKVGVSWLTYSQWEHGTQRPHPTTLDMLCDAFGMSPVELGFPDETSQEIESDETIKRREALQKIAATTGAVLMLSKLPGHVTLERLAEGLSHQSPGYSLGLLRCVSRREIAAVGKPTKRIGRGDGQ